MDVNADLFDEDLDAGDSLVEPDVQVDDLATLRDLAAVAAVDARLADELAVRRQSGSR